ncbi:uncharacterized protein LOC128896851 [Hylaeus anthracinus]|uniref:uncharacterized protein LOC128896851 n=1 Tax=Hylaeus anthracinus TaxID=313031 RepID=UPI0023B93159|nr:uncharacterized protein LOC128896851 [Hylaeus anthracinus]
MVAMQSLLAKMLLILVLSVASWSCVGAEKDVKIKSVKTDVSDGNSAVESWTTSLSNNQIDTEIKVKENCPPMIQAEIRLIKDGIIVNKFVQNMDQPFEIVKSQNLCNSVDTQEPDDKSCSAVEGEHRLSECDLSSWFSDLDDGDYTGECDIKSNNKIISTATMEVEVREK